MKPSMIRWKTVPLYSGSVVFCRVSGCVHSRRPSARSAKFATVLGAWSGKRFTRMSPWFVCRTALRAGAVDSVTPSTLPRTRTTAVRPRATSRLGEPSRRVPRETSQVDPLPGRDVDVGEVLERPVQCLRQRPGTPLGPGPAVRLVAELLAGTDGEAVDQRRERREPRDGDVLASGRRCGEGPGRHDREADGRGDRGQPLQGIGDAR